MRTSRDAGFEGEGALYVRRGVLILEVVVMIPLTLRGDGKTVDIGVGVEVGIEADL